MFLIYRDRSYHFFTATSYFSEAVSLSCDEDAGLVNYSGNTTFKLAFPTDSATLVICAYILLEVIVVFGFSF